MKRTASLPAIILLLCAGPALAQSLDGTYALKQGAATLTLVIRQGPGGQLTGQLTSKERVMIAFDHEEPDRVPA